MRMPGFAPEASSLNASAYSARNVYITGLGHSLQTKTVLGQFSETTWPSPGCSWSCGLDCSFGICTWRCGCVCLTLTPHFPPRFQGLTNGLGLGSARAAQAATTPDICATANFASVEDAMAAGCFDAVAPIG
jgi:hypothetical protein